MELTRRQEAILEIVKKEGPITGERIAERLSLTRATLRPDMAILTMTGLVTARPRVGYYYSGKSPGRVIAERLHQIKVADVKSLPVVVTERCSVYDTVVTMFVEDVGTLFVVNEKGLLEGVVSRKDLLKSTIGAQDVHKLPVSVIMTRMPNVVTVDPGDFRLDGGKETGRPRDRCRGGRPPRFRRRREKGAGGCRAPFENQHNEAVRGARGREVEKGGAAWPK